MRSQESFLYKYGGLHLSWVSVGLGGNMLRQVRETTLIRGRRRTMQHIILKDQTMFYPWIICILNTYVNKHMKLGKFRLRGWSGILVRSL